MPQINQKFVNRLQTLSNWVGKEEAIIYLRLKAGKAKIDRIALMNEEEEDDEGLGPIMELNTNLDIRKTLSYLG